MNRNVKVLCPKCGEVTNAELSLELFRDEPIDFRGEDPILVEHPELIITIQCGKCDETNIFRANAGTLFFNWGGP